MKRALLTIFIIACVFELRAQAPDPNFNDKQAFSESRLHLKKAGFLEPESYGKYNLLYQRLDFTVDPAVNAISGSVFSIVKALNTPLTELEFDLVNNLTVDSIIYHKSKISFQHVSEKIKITLGNAIPVNGNDSISIYYHGKPPGNGLGSFIASNHAGTPVIWTLSEPYGAKEWWPCKQTLKDKIDSIDVYITCPSQYKAASNGKLAGENVFGTKRIVHWKHRYPIATYLVAIAVTNYETYSDFLNLENDRRIEILNYIYPEYLVTAKTKSADILSMMKLYNELFIEYPFAKEKYGHAQFGWGGGMEHQTMSFMVNLNFELAAHEMAHQWFGDYITLNSWHDIWLNEGFATYLTGLAYEHLQNGQYWETWKQNEIIRVLSATNGSVYVADTTDINRVFSGRLSYSKGGQLLHMLRWEMGDANFFKVMNNYLKDPSVANGFASHQKFVSHLEAVADTSFTEFFNDWYYGEGYPTFWLTPFPVHGGYKLKISQTQSHSSVSFFEMHVPVRVWENGVSKDLRFHVTSHNQEFVLPVNKLDKIEFDPDHWLCAKVNVVTSVNPEIEKDQIRIIPENKQVRVCLPINETKAIIEITDISGKTILQKGLTGIDISTDISWLQGGIYLVNVKTRNQRQSEKLFIP